MEKKNIFRIVFTILVVAATLNTIAYMLLKNTPNSRTISGLISLDDLKLSPLSPTNKILITTQWLAVIVVVLISLIRGNMRLKQDIQASKNISTERFRKEKPETDIDILYEMLKKDKVIRISAITKIFGISKETALEWCKILETGNLAEIRYPTVGDAKIVLIEEETEDEKKREQEKE